MVYINDADGSFGGFKPQHVDELRLAAEFTVPTDRHQLSLLDDIYTELNVGGTYLDQAPGYRLRRNRSLSVGDVVVFWNDDESLRVAFACASMGWEPVDVQVLPV